MNHQIEFLIAALVVLCASQIIGMSGLRESLRQLERKMNAVIKHQGIEWPSHVSPEVRLMAMDPRKKILAIKLHREQNPSLGLAEAKRDVEDSISGK